MGKHNTTNTIPGAQQQCDILIIGGGLIGASLLHCLKPLGYNCKLIEKQPPGQPKQGQRYLALSPASMHIFDMLGVWGDLAKLATPIHSIHISQQGSFGKARLQRHTTAPLGYVVAAHALHAALFDTLDPKDVLAPASLDTLDPETGIAGINHNGKTISMQAPLVIAADGANSTTRKLCNLEAKTVDYEQHALVSLVTLKRNHDGLAIERFTPNGPLAFLPVNNNQAALIWTQPADRSAEIESLPDQTFIQQLQVACGYRLGRITAIGKRFMHPLKQVVMPQHTSGRVLFIGNAAHTLHPVAGQGFNLGLRDVATLAECLATHELGPRVLEEYQQSRRTDHGTITTISSGLADLFTKQFPGMSKARSLGLMTFDNFPALKNSVGRALSGYAGTPPKLACGIPLTDRSVMHEEG